MRLFAALPVVLLGVGVQGAVVYDEGVDGDLSGDRFSPTSLGPLDLGSNLLTATSVAGDLEYVTFNVPAGLDLVSVVLTSYTSVDDRSFGAIQSGTTFTEDPGAPDVSNMLGWTHFGTALGDPNPGEDLLPALAAGPGAIGFTPPLGSGDYTMWLQETGAELSTYTLEFVVVPAPAAGAPLLLLARRRRR